jgi:hypothetical protein
MAGRQDGRLVTGAILIVLGIGLLALQFVQGFGEAVIFFLVGGLFVAGYLYRRAYGLLIPGGILLGLGLGSIGKGELFQFADFEAIGLGIGFISIYVIALAYEGRTQWWPLIPGGILVITGLATGNQVLQRLVEVGWPLILVFVGLLLLASAFGLMGRRARTEEESQGQ